MESNQYILEDTTEDVVIDKLPEKCPDCGSENIRIEGCTLRTNDPVVSPDGDRLLLQDEISEVLSVQVYGWYCSSCHHEDFFDRIYRMAWI